MNEQLSAALKAANAKKAAARAYFVQLLETGNLVAAVATADFTANLKVLCCVKDKTTQPRQSFSRAQRIQEFVAAAGQPVSAMQLFERFDVSTREVRAMIRRGDVQLVEVADGSFAPAAM